MLSFDSLLSQVGLLIFHIHYCVAMLKLPFEIQMFQCNIISLKITILGFFKSGNILVMNNRVLSKLDLISDASFLSEEGKFVSYYN